MEFIKMKIKFIDKNFRYDSLALINLINTIADDYVSQGYTLTVRQMYYQLVARDLIENTIRSYQKIAKLINEGKNAGLISWYAFEDRTRAFIKNTHWDNPQQIINAAAEGYFESMWDSQSNYKVYVIIEKEALVGILEATCAKYDVPILAARGYPSGTVLFDFFKKEIEPNPDKIHVILHLGDHDPSGIDMTRDLTDRMDMFSHSNYTLIVKRLALNYNQIEELRPPKNPAKDTDSRFTSYVNKFGYSSWELDALNPSYLNSLVTKNIELHIDFSTWEAKKYDIEGKKAQLKALAKTKF